MSSPEPSGVTPAVPGRTGRVFISHSSRDRDVAHTICTALESRGVRCWVSSRDIKPGENFQEAIVRAIRQAGVMVLVFTGNANNSNEIKKEVALASQANLAVIPLRVEDVVPDDAFRYELATRQWIDAFDNWEHAIERLSHQITAFLGEPVPGAVAFAAAKPARGGRTGLIAAAVVVLLAAAGAGAWLALRPPAGASQQRVVATAAPATPAAAPAAPAAAPAPTTTTAAPIAGAPAPTAAPPPSAAAPASGTSAGDQSAAATPPSEAPANSATDPVDPNRGTMLAANQAFQSKDFVEAARLYRTLADENNSGAQRMLGVLYQRGEGVTQDYAEAMRLFRRSAVSGNGTAMGNIGNLYHHGLGVPPDLAEAQRWYRMSANNNAAMGMWGLGLLYQAGQGVPRDYSEAKRWYERAAEQNFAPALYSLGLLYENGYGVNQNLRQGHKLIAKAADSGDPQAQKWLETHKASGGE